MCTSFNWLVEALFQDPDYLSVTLESKVLQPNCFEDLVNTNDGHDNMRKRMGNGEGEGEIYGIFNDGRHM